MKFRETTTQTTRTPAPPPPSLPWRPAVLFAFVSFLLAPGLALADAGRTDTDPLDRLRPGEWYEVPDSHLQAVAAPASKFPWLRGGVGGVIDCWAGGAFDSQRDRLYVGPGGGHGGYNGNEVYAFDLHDMKWHRLNDPDPVVHGNEYTDPEKAPFAMHTYDAVEYLPPPADRYVVVGGWGTPRTYALDPGHPDRWEVYPDHGTGRTGDLCGYDPIGQLLWLSTPTSAGKLSQWDPLAHRWTLRTAGSPEPSYYETADVDYKRRLLVSCGRGKLKTWRLAPAPGAVASDSVKATGDAEVMDAPSPGFCYVPADRPIRSLGKGGRRLHAGRGSTPVDEAPAGGDQPRRAGAARAVGHVRAVPLRPVPQRVHPL